MFRLVTLIIICTFSLHIFAQNKLQTGDLLFQELNEGDFSDAIKAVTESKDNAGYAHVGIVNVTDTGIFVIEAISAGVSYTCLDTFLKRNSGYSTDCFRLQPAYTRLIPKAVEEALKHLGKPYDFAFDMANDKYYCSELVYVAFAGASGDTLFFETPPMTFKDPGTGKFNKNWLDYFKALSIEIPEGERGLNPGGMSRSEKLKKTDWQPEK